MRRRRTGAKRRRRTSRSAFMPLTASAPAEQRPTRGVKLKTVSRLTLLFALVFLGAFMAGRPPVEAGGRSESIQSHERRIRAERKSLRNDNARRVLFSVSR
jgi:hypothetical protein